jgi:hypothetical protein
MKWNSGIIQDLQSLSSTKLSDHEIALLLSRKYGERITPTSVKRKRQRSGFRKRESRVIDSRKFVASVSMRKDLRRLHPVILPVEIANTSGFSGNEILLIKVKNLVFPVNIRRRWQKRRNNWRYYFYLPHGFQEDYKLQSPEYITFEILATPNEEGPIIVENSGSKSIDLLMLLKNAGEPGLSFLKTLSNDLWVWKGKHSSILTLPRYIKICSDLFQVFGLYRGDGTKANPRRVEFCNSDPHLVNSFLGFCERKLKISRNNWRARVVYCRDTRRKELEERLIKKWSEFTGIEEKNFVKTGFVRKIGEESAPYGTLQVYFSSNAFHAVFSIFSNFIEHMLLENDENAIGFIQGVFAADATPILKSNGHLDSVSIRIECEEEGILYLRCAYKLAIDAHLKLRQRKIVIYGLRNFLRIYCYDLFKLHSGRMNKFLRGLQRLRHARDYVPELVSKLAED